jgi:phosphonoacetaldehyde hydrolase
MNYTYRRTYNGPIQAVVLDWAGTAVDYGSFAPTAVFLRLFELRGVQITADDARSGMGLMKKDHLRTILARPAVSAAWQAIHGAPPIENDVDDLFENFIPMQHEVLKAYADPIPGLLDTVGSLRDQGIKIGSTTGYLRGMMDILEPEAARRGYAPDCIVCPDEVTAGRPAPWMCYRNAMLLDTYPMQAMVKVGDTLVDIEEGLNAGMWSVGITLSGNLVGLNEAEVGALSETERLAAKQKAAGQLLQAGAHLVIDGIWELPTALLEIEARLKCGVTP